MSGHVGSLRFMSEGKSTGETFPDERSTSTIETRGETRGEVGVEVEAAIVEVPT